MISGRTKKINPKEWKDVRNYFCKTKDTHSNYWEIISASGKDACSLELELLGSGTALEISFSPMAHLLPFMHHLCSHLSVDHYLNLSIPVQLPYNFCIGIYLDY